MQGGGRTIHISGGEDERLPRGSSPWGGGAAAEPPWGPGAAPPPPRPPDRGPVVAELDEDAHLAHQLAGYGTSQPDSVLEPPEEEDEGEAEAEDEAAEGERAAAARGNRNLGQNAHCAWSLPLCLESPMFDEG